jgi:putative ABC transport system permease protein
MADNSSGVGQNEGGSINTVYFLIIISIFILVIAWINYINLSTARAVERAKEVGIKKAIGIFKGQLVGQFLFESIVINFISVVLSVCLAIPLMSFLNGIMEKNFHFDFSRLEIWIWLTVLFAFGSVISGFYPALILSSFRIVDVIKGNSVRKIGGLNLRKALVVFQFAASLVLIVGTFTVYQQVKFMQRKSDQNANTQILIIKGPQATDSASFTTRLLSLKNSLLQISTVEKVATSDAIPGSGYNWAVHAAKKGMTNEEGIGAQNMDVVFVDPDFLQTYGIKMLAGKSWESSSATEMKSIVINEASLKAFDFISAEMAVEESMVFNNDYTAPILGVVKNLHWYSLKNKFTPMVLWPQEVCSGWYSVVISDNIRETISQIEKQFKAKFPDNPFEYYFYDDFFNQQYKAEQQFGKIFSLFTVLGVLVACLGLWGLASFTSVQRVKEIGIRKVLGASSNIIVGLLSRDFFKILLVASIIALPCMWFVADSWLDNFAFRIQLSYDLFLLPTIFLLMLGMGTVSFHTLRAAKANPAESLKN